ncbi:MAG: hypothetical protein ACI8YI_002068, partial [Paracoccaceae bacterium]
GKKFADKFGNPAPRLSKYTRNRCHIRAIACPAAPN